MARYIIDPLHSEVEFKVKHLMITSVNGRFTEFAATLDSDSEDWLDAHLEFEANIASINTGVADRDMHLRTNDFFDAPRYPKMTFVSTGIKKTGEKLYEIDGKLSVKGTEKAVKLQATYNGSDVDAYDQRKYGFEITGEISRAEFGLTLNPTGKHGAVLIDDKIKMLINAQMIKAVA
jgi:polyisoprenoid-binding protein YceI